MAGMLLNSFLKPKAKWSQSEAICAYTTAWIVIQCTDYILLYIACKNLYENLCYESLKLAVRARIVRSRSIDDTQHSWQCDCRRPLIANEINESNKYWSNHEILDTLLRSRPNKNKFNDDDMSKFHFMFSVSSDFWAPINWVYHPIIV